MNSRHVFVNIGITIIAVLTAVPLEVVLAEDDETYILAAGRRLPYLYAISLRDAVDPANNLTPNAIISRSKVALDGLNGRPWAIRPISS